MILKRSLTSGFTLVELLLYFGLSAIILVVMTELFLSLLEIKTKSESTSSVAVDSQYLPIRLQYDIDHADSIILPSSLGESGTQLRLVIGGEIITYSQQGTQLVRTSSIGTLPLLSGTEVSELQFKRLGNVGGKHTISVSYRLTSPIELPSGKHSLYYQTTLGVR